MDLLVQELKRFRDFSGTSSRPEFWTLFIAVLAVMFIINHLLSMLYTSDVQTSENSAEGLLVPLWSIPIIIALLPAMVWFFLVQLSAGVRRLRDAGYNPLWILLSAVPFGVFALLFMWAAPTKNSNA